MQDGQILFLSCALFNDASAFDMCATSHMGHMGQVVYKRGSEDHMQFWSEESGL